MKYLMEFKVKCIRQRCESYATDFFFQIFLNPEISVQNFAGEHHRRAQKQTVEKLRDNRKYLETARKREIICPRSWRRGKGVAKV